MRNLPRGWFVLVGLLMLLPGVKARAWNSTGHQVVAEIAWRELKPAVREKVLAILRQHPQFAAQLEPSEVKADSAEFGERVFARASTWPDIVRSARGKDREFHHPEWHYINTPI